MEYRLKYRDIPWSVAIGVLPGKIIGTFLIKPWLRFKRNWQRTVVRWLTGFMVTIIALMLVLLLMTLLDTVTDGSVQKLLIDAGILNVHNMTTPPPVSVPPAVEIIGNHR